MILGFSIFISSRDENFKKAKIKDQLIEIAFTPERLKIFQNACQRKLNSAAELFMQSAPNKPKHNVSEWKI